MKKILFIATIAATTLTAVFAQEKKANDANQQKVEAPQRKSGYGGQASAETIAQIKTKRINDIVTLTEEQKKGVYDLYLKEQVSLRQRSPNHQDARPMVDGLLSSEQKQKLETYEAEKKQKMMERTATQKSELKAAPGKIK